jgi:hypothetical protein
MRYFLILFLLLTVPASAEQIVCSKDGALTRYEGDCFKLGICSGYNNTGIKTGCIIATSGEYQNAGSRYYKLDANVVNGPRIVEMTQAEKDQLDVAKIVAEQDAKNARIAIIDDNMSAVPNISLTKVDNAIDNISNLNDAKAFLKKLCRYIAATSR